MSEFRKPVPAPTDASRPFWAGCAEGKLLLRRCRQCDKHHAPTRHVCSCGGSDLEWTEVSGLGRVFSYTVVHRAPDPAFKADGIAAVGFELFWVQDDKEQKVAADLDWAKARLAQPDAALAVGDLTHAAHSQAQRSCGRGR